MTLRIGILQTGDNADELRDDFPNYDDMFRAILGPSFACTTYRILDNEFPASIDCEQGYLITGSRFGAYEEHAWIPPLEQFIRDSYAAGIPQVGVCFGHQIIAQALGGVVEKFDGGWAVGRQSYSRLSDGATLDCYAFHQDQVVKKPADAQLIYTSDFCKNAGFIYDNKAFSVQPHPEFTRDFIRELIIVRDNNYPSTFRDQALAALGDDAGGEFVARITQFFQDNIVEAH